MFPLPKEPGYLFSLILLHLSGPIQVPLVHEAFPDTSPQPHAISSSSLKTTKGPGDLGLPGGAVPVSLGRLDAPQRQNAYPQGAKSRAGHRALVRCPTRTWVGDGQGTSLHLLSALREPQPSIRGELPNEVISVPWLVGW